MGNRSTTRTAVLSTVVFLALVALIVVAVLIVKDKTSTSGAPSTTTVSTTPTTTTPSTTTPSTTSTTSVAESTPESTHTRPTGEPGTVVYQLTGDGDVIGVTYRTGNRSRVVAVAGTPWQQRTTLTDRRAEISGVVVRGKITCLILQGEELLASSTAGVGPFSCSATLPR